MYQYSGEIRGGGAVGDNRPAAQVECILLLSKEPRTCSFRSVHLAFNPDRYGLDCITKTHLESIVCGNLP